MILTKVRTANFLYVAIFVGGCGRRIKFMHKVDGHALEGHVFKNLSIDMYTQCEDYCVREKECVAVNIGPLINDKVVCELSDSDNLQQPDDFKPRGG